MAHGFLTPTPVSGDRFWQNAKWLKKKLDDLLKKKDQKPEKGGALAVSRQDLDMVDQSVQQVKVVEEQNKSAAKSALAAKMLAGSATAKMLGSGKSSIIKKEQLALPPGGPRLPGGASPTKGGTFTNIPGVSAAPKKLDSEAFFKAAQTGVHPETGKYLSSQERKDYLKKSKAQMNAPASVAAGGAAGIGSSSSVITKGDETIVGSIEKLTKVTTSLVDVVKKQTSTQKQSSDKATAKAETIANRAKASEEEKALEQGTDNSGFITPEGGLGSMSRSGGRGGGGGGLGLGTALGAAGKIIGKAAPGIAARGAARALPRAGAMVAGKAGAKFGAKALTKMAGKTASRLIPGAQTAIGLGLAGEALSRGDILGAALSAGSAIPGPLGWGFLAADVARDLSGGGEKGYAGGGLVSGGKKSVVDDVPIRADEGEVVMSNAAGNAFGRSTLLAMNAMGGGTNKPTGGKGYSEGGLVGGDKAKSKQMFKLFGEGMIDAQKANSRDFAKIQSAGMRQYYENEGGGERLGKSLANIWGKIGGVLGSLFSGTLTSLMGGSAGATELGNPADYLGAAAGGQDTMTLATIAALESGSSQGQADVAQSVYNRLADKTYGSSITDILTRQGQYQVAFKDPTASRGAGTQVADEFKNIRTEDDAVKAMMYYFKKRGHNVTEAQARSKVRSSLAAIQNVELQKKAAQHVGGRTEFLARGQGGRGSVSRGGGSDNDFFAAYGSGNQMKRGAAAIPIGLFRDDVFSPTGAGPGTGGSKLENDILAFRQARTKFGVSAKRVATGTTFNLAIRELRGEKGGSSINPLADDTSYEDIHSSQAHKQGYGFDVPVSGREQANFVIQFFRSRGYQTIHGRAEDPSGGHDHHVHVQAPDSKAKEFMAAVKPKPKPKPAQGTGTAAQTGAKTKADLMGSAAPPAPSGQQLAQASTEDAVSQRRRTKADTVGNTTIINNNTQQASATGSGLTPGTGSSGMGLTWLALATRK